MAQPSRQSAAKQPKWTVSLDPKEYVNSTAISSDGTLVMAGTFFHSYKQIDLLPEAAPAEGSGPTTFGTYCFDNNGKQLWADNFKGYEGVYCVGISDDGSTAVSGGWYSNHPFEGFVRAFSSSNGTRILNYLVKDARISAVALSKDGKTLAAGGNSLYLFQRSGPTFPGTPSILKLTGNRNSVQALSISSDGKAIIMGDALGNVYLIQNNDGQIGQVYQWNSPSLKTIHGVALAATGSWFAVVGYSQFVYLFTAETIKNKNYFATFDLGKPVRAGWVAISGAGDFIAAVCNDGKAGLLYGLQRNDSQLQLLWSKPQTTLANPNSTSVDLDAKYVSVADGYPDGTPGHFYLFDGKTGEQKWQYETSNMSWPMFLSSNGAGIAAGSDLGCVYYFTPE